MTEAEFRLSTETLLERKSLEKGRISAYQVILTTMGKKSVLTQPAQKELSNREIKDRINESKRVRDPRRVFNVPFKANDDD